MVSSQEIVNWVSDGVNFLQNHLPWHQLPEPTVVAATAVVGGLILSLWGARFLRVIFVLSFMVGGAVLGVQIARACQVELLIGLVLGGGAAALVGHLFYRWWVGVITGICAVLLVLAIGGPKVFPQEIEGLKSFVVQQLEVGGDSYILPDPQDATGPSSGQILSPEVLKDYFWNNRRQFVTRMGVALGLAWVLGLVIGVTMPRFSSVVGTSLLGVSALTLGSGSLLSIHKPVFWNKILANPTLFLVGVGLLLLISLSIQAQGRRAVKVVSPEPIAK